MRRLVLGNGLFKFIDYFLYIGQQNKWFYEHMGITAGKLLFCPYSVDNERFQQGSLQLASQRDIVRKRLNLPVKAFVILYSGKYTPKKRPIDLLQAVAKLAQPDITLVLMGDGILRTDLEQFITDNSLKNVVLTGFINQSKISDYYAVADVYVMCSTEEETWGLSTNEAMNFSLPVVLSDTIGCADDLVQEGVNGYSYPCGNVPELADRLARLFALPPHERQAMGQASLALINQYSYAQTVQSLKTALRPVSS